MRHVYGQPQIIEHLFVMGAALCGGALLLGPGADRLQRRSVRPQALLACVAIVFVTAQIVLIAGWRIPSLLVWR